MNRFLNLLYPTALGAGLLAIAWAGSAALRHHPLALLMTALIAGFYALGAWELQRFRRASRGLQAVLEQPLSSTGGTSREDWLRAVPASLREPVRQRLDGARSSLPGPMLAPALAGLLVLLGMLGTFVGLIMTLGGTAAALNASQDLSAMRLALTTPVQGLGLAFGTSVAGVAASAMLGLMAALARRERATATQALEQALGSSLRPFTAAERLAQVQQAQLALPLLVEQVQQLAQQLSAQQTAFQQQALVEQQRFHAQTEQVYSGLAASVDRSLRDSLSESARQAGAVLQPAAEAAMAGIAREASALHQRTAETVQTQLDRLGRRFETGVAELQQRQGEALAAERAASADHRSGLQRLLAEGVAQNRAELATTLQQTRELLQALGQQAEQTAGQWTERFQAQTASLLQSLADTHTRQLATQGQGDAERLAAWRAELAGMAAGLRESWSETAARAQLQQQQVVDALAQTAQQLLVQTEASARATLGEVGGLLQSAAEAPRAAAEVVGALREQLSQSLARDNAALSERAQLLQTLSTLLGTLQQAAGEQRQAIDGLVDGAARLLDEAGQRFAAQSAASGEQLLAASEQLSERSARALEQVGSGFITQAEASGARLAEASRALAEQTAQLLEQAGSRFATQAERTGEQLGQAAVQLAGSAAEMGSLGEGFGAAVEQFQQANQGLLGHLQHLDGALERSISRSDEQLAYYVAQARELIDLCLSSQKQAVDELRAAAQLQHG